ncbi:MAG: endolytic transglycosylase MltG [Candidatus Paceibacterota bacterium]|jgi:UPF0755 protein
MFLKHWKIILLVTVFVLFFVITIKTVFPPANFPTNPFYHVDRGKSVAQVAGELKAKNFIQSPLAFKIFVRLLGGEKRMQVGTYFFKQPISSINIALKLTHHFLGEKPITVTIYEGMTNAKIAKLLAQKLPPIKADDFIAQAKNLQGRLFPDTYFFSPYDTVEDIIYELNQNFDEQIAKLKIDVVLSGQTLNQILVMASIIEGEANKDVDRHLISGILWKRLSIEMPLQVDVAKETYKQQGLPDAPINNPGLEAIEAAIYPETSDYLYYLTGRDGQMYYAEDFAGHKKNRRLYLD